MEHCSLVRPSVAGRFCHICGFSGTFPGSQYTIGYGSGTREAIEIKISGSRNTAGCGCVPELKSGISDTDRQMIYVPTQKSKENIILAICTLKYVLLCAILYRLHLLEEIRLSYPSISRNL